MHFMFILLLFGIAIRDNLIAVLSPLASKKLMPEIWKAIPCITGGLKGHIKLENCPSFIIQSD